MTAKPDNRKTERWIPPHDLTAEAATLGAMMLGDVAAVDVAFSVLESRDFFAEHYALIFEAMERLHESGKPLETVTLKDELTRSGTLDQAGGLVQLLQLAELEFTTANLPHYAGIVQSKAMQRRLIEACNRIAGAAYTNYGTADEQLAQAEQEIFECGTKRGGSGWSKASELAKDSWEAIDARHQAGGGMPGISTGLVDLDRVTLGLKPGELIILAGRPSMGKTGIATCITVNVARRGGVVGFVSLEMTKGQLTERLLATEARIDLQRLQKAEMTEEEWKRLADAHTLMHSLPFAIDDHSDYTALELEGKARRLRAEMGRLDLIVIDYLQYLSGPRNQRGENRNSEIESIVKGLKRMAKTLNVPVVVLAQLSRNVERREDKRPILSDLRDSGSIEAEADIVGFLYRAAYYDKSLTPSPGEVEEAEVIIAKNRNGPTGFVKLAFRPEYTRFDNLAHGTY